MKKSFKRILSACLTLLIIFSNQVFISAKTPSKFTVEVVSAECKANEEVQVKIELKNNPGISSLKLNVTYDDILTLKKITFNKEFGSYVTAPEPYKNPQPLSLISPLDDIKINGTFATLTFKVSSKAVSGYVANIELSYDEDNIFNKDYKNIDTDIVNGNVKISGGNQSGYIINLNSNGGNTQYNFYEVKDKIEFGDLPKPEKSNYKFVGWFSEKSGGTRYHDDEVVNLSSNQTIYAHWIDSNKPSVTSVSVDGFEVKYKKTATLSPEVKTDGNVKYTVTYKSSNPEIASVDKNGTVTGLKYGSATITCYATDENGITVKNTCTVEVKYIWWQVLIIIFLFGWIWYI